MTNTATTTTVEDSMAVIFNRCAFQASTTVDFMERLRAVSIEFAPRPAVKAEWIRFCAAQFANMVDGQVS